MDADVKYTTNPEIPQPKMDLMSFGVNSVEIATLAQLTNFMCQEINRAEEDLGINSRDGKNPAIYSAKVNITLPEAKNMITQRVTEFTQKSYDFIYKDLLTGLFNKRAYERDRSDLIRKFALNKGNFGLIIFDLDNFKKYNDTFGHQKGDNALKVYASVICDAVGNKGRVYRVGGEEFSAFIQDADYEEIGNIAENARKNLREVACKKFMNDELCDIITVSAGYDVFNPLADYPIESIADKALYAAKKRGKNKTVGAREINLEDLKK